MPLLHGFIAARPGAAQPFRLHALVLVCALQALVPFAAQAAAAAPAIATLDQVRAELQQIRQAYEARIRALEDRLVEAERRLAAPLVQSPSQPAVTAAPGAAVVVRTGAADTPAAPASAPARGAAAGNAFNPEIGLVLNGTWSRLARDPATWRVQGFVPPGGEIGPGTRSFSLGESELQFAANIDPLFSGRLIAALGAEGEVSVEEALIETRGLEHGLTVRAGRFLSGIGYLNEQHRHTWDFTDAPLAYQAFLGGQYRPDGLQLRWLAPTERYLEFGLEAGNGQAFPGSDRNRNGAGAVSLFARTGDDWGTSWSWRAGAALLRTTASDRAWEDGDSTGTLVRNGFTGHSRTLLIDGVVKWAPGGNATRQSFKLQGEWFRRTERGSVTYDLDAVSLGTQSDVWRSAQSGGYAQAVWQFMPRWRTGLRLDRLNPGTVTNGLIDAGALTAADFPGLAAHRPRRESLMIDWSPSEFARIRLQFARDRARAGAADNQIFLQYIMSLGAHKAHAF